MNLKNNGVCVNCGRKCGATILWQNYDEVDEIVAYPILNFCCKNPELDIRNKGLLAAQKKRKVSILTNS